MTIGLAAVRVLVMVIGGDSVDGTRPIEAALHAALAKDATIIVRASPDTTSEEAMKTAATAEDASLLGVVVWSDKQRRASIRFVRPADGHWMQRDVRFDSADQPTEKARTAGFALASMMPEEALVEHPTTPAPPPPASVAPVALTAPAPTVVDRVVVAPKVPPRPNPFAIDLSTLAALSSDGYGGGIGGTLAVRVPLWEALALRFAGSARFGEIAPAQATSRVFTGGAGVAWQPWLDADRRLALGVRTDFLVVVQQVSHLSDDDLSAKLLTHALLGVDGAIEGAYRFADRAALVAALGGELAFGSTEVYVRDRRVGALTPLRGLAEAGIRVAF